MQIRQRSPLSAQAMDSSGIRSRIARSSDGTICSTVTPSRLITPANCAGSLTSSLAQIWTRPPTIRAVRNCQIEISKLWGAVWAITSAADKPSSEILERR